MGKRFPISVPPGFKSPKSPAPFSVNKGGQGLVDKFRGNYASKKKSKGKKRSA